jgi:hypothetical protein
MQEQQQQTFLDTTEPMPGEYEVPEGPRAERCRSCGTRIVWGQTRAGEPIPLSVATLRTIGARRYAKTHFIDCPHGREWRKK